MEELKPCPFCGNSPEFRFVEVDEPVTNFDRYYEIRCPYCKSKGLRIRYTIRKLCDKEEHEKAKENLSYEWNSRIKKADS